MEELNLYQDDEDEFDDSLYYLDDNETPFEEVEMVSSIPYEVLFNPDLVHQMSNYMDSQSYKQFRATNRFNRNLSNQDPLSKIINSNQYNILLSLDFKTLEKLSKTNRRLKNVLKNNDFWQLKFQYDQHLFILPNQNLIHYYTHDWFQIYKDLTIIKNVVNRLDYGDTLKFSIIHQQKALKILRQYVIFDYRYFNTNLIYFLIKKGNYGYHFDFYRDEDHSIDRYYSKDMDLMRMVDFLYLLLSSKAVIKL
jgi:hypothetical protein